MTSMAGSQRRRGRLIADARTPEPRRLQRDRGRALTYLAVRLTGVLLAVLVLGHFAVTHIVTDVAQTDAQFIARRWSSALWVAWDVTMLLAAFAHGVAGVLVSIADYVPDVRARRRRQRALIAIVTALVAIGLVVIWRLTSG
jgi:succinate dehydrogenase hydrophobic anchor subunit